MANPRLGVQNLFEDHPILRSVSAASGDQTGFPVDNIRDGREGTLWKPGWDANPPPVAEVRVYPVLGQLIPVGWYFRDFSNGAAAAPDGWTLFDNAAGTAITGRDLVNNQIDDNAVLLTRAGDDADLRQALARPVLLRGAQITAGIIAVASTASTTRVSLFTGGTGGGVTSSSFHTGGGTPEFLTVTATVPFDSTNIQVRLERITTDGTSFFDGAIAVVGASVVQPPHDVDVDYVALFGHNLGTAIQTLRVQTTADPSDWSAPATHLTVLPTDDNALFRDFATVNNNAFRLTFTGTTGSHGAEIGVAHLGELFQWPFPLEFGFNPYGRELASSLPSNRDGAPLGRAIRRAPIRLDLNSPFPAEADFAGAAVQAMLDKVVKQGRTFFLQWEDDNHEDQTFFCWVPERGRFGAPLRSGIIAERMQLQVMGVQE